MKKLMMRSNNFNELLFENRNKSYGAYVLRKEYDERLMQSFFVAMLSLLLLAGIFSYLNKNTESNLLPPAAKEQVIFEVNITPPKKIEKTETAAPKTESVQKPIVENTTVAPIVDNSALQVNNVETTPVASTSSTSETSLGSLTATTSTATPALNTAEEGAEAAPLEYAAADVSPEFPGGDPAMRKFLAENIKYPQWAIAEGIKGTVYVSFVVDSYGKITSISLLKGINADFNDEVMRVVNLFPKWKPGMYKGKAVSIHFNLPVKFELRNN